MNVAFIPGNAVVIPGLVAVVFAAQVDLSLMSPALWIASSILLLRPYLIGRKRSLHFTFFTNSILKSSFTKKRFTWHASGTLSHLSLDILFLSSFIN